jgi:hypothetical protein
MPQHNIMGHILLAFLGPMLMVISGVIINAHKQIWNTFKGL